MKYLSKVLLLTLFVFSFFVLQTGSTSAAGFEVCSGATGCRKCAPNTSDPNVCQLEDQGVSPGVACAAGANAPASAAAECAAIADNPGGCNAHYIACSGTTVPNGGYYCNTSGAVPSCTACDNDTATSLPACPGGAAAPFSTESSCHTNCDLAAGNFTCIPSGGTCKTACAVNTDDELTGATCQTGVCCRPKSARAIQTTSTNVRLDCPENNVSTAIGCIPIGNLGDFASFFLKWGLGISGGIAIFMLVFSSFLIMTSGGDPKKLQTGKELLFSVVSGIVLLVFSMFILRVLGVNVLGLI